MAKIKIKQGAGDDPGELVASILAGQSLPFMATITHQAVKPLVVPSTGINDVIAPGEAVSFKVKSFEQVWVLVTDSAALAKRYDSTAEDFVVIGVPAVEGVAPIAALDDQVPAETKPTGKGGSKSAAAASE